MSIHVIKMPDLGEGIAEVELVAWRVAPGERVTEDQVLADVMTDKATVEIPSPVHGTVLALGGVVGQVLAVGAELIRIEVAGEAGDSAPAAKAAPQESAAASPPPPLAPAAAPASAPKPDHAASEKTPENDKPIASPALRRRAWELGVDLQQLPPAAPVAASCRPIWMPTSPCMEGAQGARPPFRG